jgi:hypothetical protein
MSLGIVAYADNPLLGGRDCEDCGWRQKEFVTLHLNRKKKMGNGGVPVIPAIVGSVK